jgi:hypothetical protein
MDLIFKKENWNKLREKLNEKYPQLTEADLQYNEGTEFNMLRMVEYKLRKTKQEMREIISGL